MNRAPPLSRGPFFGWYVVGGAFTVLTVVYGLQFSYGVLMPSMAAELGWARSTLSAPFSLYILIYTWLSFFSGKLTDRFGPGRVIALGALGLGSGYALLGRTEAEWALYLALCGLAALGASVAFVPCNATVIRWFVRRRGLALGVASAGVSVAAIVGPLSAAGLLTAFDWRGTFVVLGTGGALAMLAASAVMVRDPESRGLQPDGGSLGLTQAGPVEGVSLQLARRTPAFWLLMASLFCTWLAIFFPFVHLAGHALDLGATPAEAASLMALVGIGGLVGRTLGGGASDRVGRKPGLALSIVLQGVAFLGLGSTQALGWVGLYAFLFGAGYSGVSVLFPALLGDLFGRRHIGTIVGFVFATAGSAAAAGPWLAALVYDATGAFTGAFLLAAGLNVLSFGALVFLRSPAR